MPNMRGADQGFWFTGGGGGGANLNLNIILAVVSKIWRARRKLEIVDDMSPMKKFFMRQINRNILYLLRVTNDLWKIVDALGILEGAYAPLNPRMYTVSISYGSKIKLTT